MLKTSLLITGDASGAVAAADQTQAAVEQAGAASRTAAAGAAELTAEADKLARGLSDVASAAAPAAAATGALASEAGQLDVALGRVGSATGATGGRLKEAQRELAATEAAANRNAYGLRNLGQQFGDLGLSIAGGIDPARAFGQQAGQMGYALSEMEGKAGALGAFLTGPWGIALTVATAVLAPFVEELFKAGDAADNAKLGASGLADAQGVLAQVFDQASSKIAAQNQLLILNARLTAINLRADAAKEKTSSAAAFDSAGDPSTSDRVRGAFEGGGRGGVLGAIIGAYGGTAGGGQIRQNLSGIVSGIRAGRISPQDALKSSERLDFTGSNLTRQQFQQAIIDAASSEAKGQIADLIDKSLDDGKLADGLRKDTKTRTGRTTKPRTAPDLSQFGQDTGARLAGIAEQFDDTPAAVKRVDAALREVDHILDEVQKKKPPNWQQLLEQGEQLKGVIQDGLTKPLRDFVKGQQDAFAVGQALLAGDQARADALRTIAGLERQMGPLTDAEKDAVLATEQALEAQARQLDILHEKQQIYLNGLGQIKGIVQDATQAFVRGDLGQFIKSPGKLLQAFESVKGEELFNKLFDGAFRELQDQVTGTHIVEDASTVMASAVDSVTASTRRTGAALGELAAAARGTAAAVRGGAVGAAAPAGGTGAVASAIAAPASLGSVAPAMIAFAPALAAALHLTQRASSADGGGVDANGDVVVVGRRTPSMSSEQLFTDAIGKVGTKVAGLFTNDDNAKAIGGAIGKYAGKGLEGAATGSVVAGVANSFGLKLSNTGAQIGGAIGNFIPIPGGSIIGSVLGGVVGKLFAPKAKPGGATVSSVDGEAGVSGSVGSDKAGIAAGNSLGGEVASTINQVVQQLGGTLGNFSVQIGKYKDDLRVNVNGKALGGVKGSGASGFGDDENAAVNFAAAQAIGQGAVQGVSDAVAKALRSSTNVDKALKEALKVQDLETSIGGIGAQIAKQFKDFEAQAKERLRIATQYGFDVVAIEKKNADDRAKLQDQLLKSQVGSLQSLVDEITQGSLFEGSALDRIGVLNDAIAKAKRDLDAGVDGAGDTLANLYAQRLDASKDAYATTGGYAAERSDTLDQARAAIAAANARITEASKGTDPALATTNAALDENNDQNAQLLAGQATTNSLLQQLTKTGIIKADLSLTGWAPA